MVGASSSNCGNSRTDRLFSSWTVGIRSVSGGSSGAYVVIVEKKGDKEVSTCTQRVQKVLQGLHVPRNHQVRNMGFQLHLFQINQTYTPKFYTLYILYVCMYVCMQAKVDFYRPHRLRRFARRRSLVSVSCPTPHTSRCHCRQPDRTIIDNPPPQIILSKNKKNCIKKTSVNYYRL